MAEVRLFAAARAAAGTTSVDVPAGSVAEVLAVLADKYGEPLARVLARSSYLVDGVACHDREAPLATGATVDVLPPFAGG